jgi:hypothetical protein
MPHLLGENFGSDSLQLKMGLSDAYLNGAVAVGVVRLVAWLRR